MNSLAKLQEIRDYGGARRTAGLPDQVVQRFEGLDNTLNEAIEWAHSEHRRLRDEFPKLLQGSEKELIAAVQAGYVNFYPAEQTNPYATLAASGPWIVTTHGAVLHDSGGYGMLGFGHSPHGVIKAMSDRHVMANIMTPNFSQLRLFKRLQAEIGHSRNDQPFSRYICMNSGSESVTVAARISDINAKQQTEAGGPHCDKAIMFLSLSGGFHGRTDRPAQASSSTMHNYQVLASFAGRQTVRTVIPNDLESLQAAFDWADQEGVFFEACMMEPVMGEGNPGKALTREFYDLARELSRSHNSLLVVDSIQAGLRAQGCLSLCDYPGFQSCEPPDMETYSKALNAGQYPLSVLALTEASAQIYIRGVYGNTMTSNPRALEVACSVLDQVTPELRQNIKDRGVEFVNKLKKLQDAHPTVIRQVQGTGLLVSAEIYSEAFKVVGFDELEEYLRRQGIGVIHGGQNALRFTPHFNLTSAEIDLIIESLNEAFMNGPRRQIDAEIGVGT